jgi:virulence-associated protein VagC
VRRFLQSIRPLAIGVGFGGALLGLLVALVLVFGLGKEVTLIAPHDPSTVEVNRALHGPGEPVAEIYGIPTKEKVTIIAPDGDRLIRPEEDPSLLLMKVDKQAGENPLQARTVWFFAKPVLPALLLLGIVGLFLPKRREA